MLEFLKAFDCFANAHILGQYEKLEAAAARRSYLNDQNSFHLTIDTPPGLTGVITLIFQDVDTPCTPKGVSIVEISLF